MKQGLSIQELAVELARRAEAKADYVSDTRELTLLTPRVGEGAPGAAPEIHMAGGIGEFSLSTHAQHQIAARLDVPRKFWDRLRTGHPDLLDHNVNALFRREPERRMIRTLDGRARAFLSDRYRRLDDEQVAEAIIPVLADIPDVRFESCQVTERHLYIKAVTPRIQADVKVGDTVQAGVVIRNSEVGSGSLSVQPMIFRLVCLNGMVAGKAVRKYHTGRQVSANEESYEIYRDETMQADDKALMMKVADLVRAAVDDTKFQAIVAQMRDAAESTKMVNPVDSVERLAKRFVLTDSEKGGVLARLIEGADVSQYGLTNAVTRHSQDVDSYERASEMEVMGGEILNLTKREWASVAA